MNGTHVNSELQKRSHLDWGKALHFYWLDVIFNYYFLMLWCHWLGKNGRHLACKTSC